MRPNWPRASALAEGATDVLIRILKRLSKWFRISNNVGTYHNVDCVAPEKAKVIHKLTDYLCFQMRNITVDLPDHVPHAPIAMQSEAYSQYMHYMYSGGTSPKLIQCSTSYQCIWYEM
ncbi:hypothetical protein MLD38_031291 [Melastoma candidum]|uniref:Uncharacterized protein n=1 Tax=Melastoma candidum TaxID=119954 RepID=A0ACB9MNV2_9MYRT|nr:hypothetical protein MLD38_031291 [Melastoma candidum]